MSTTAGATWRAVRKGGRRILPSPLRIGSVLVVLCSVLAFETTNATAIGTAAPKVVAASLASSSAVPLMTVHPIGVTRAVSTKATPRRSSLKAQVSAATSHVAADPATRHHSTEETRRVSSRASSPTSAPEASGCAAALTYLSAHSAPGFHFVCPGYAQGHQAMTCINVAGICPGAHLIVINVPCAAAYMNEASNSWVLDGLRSAPIDPYGYCS
jgi:hypothetical protein